MRPYRGKAVLYVLLVIVGTLIALAPPYFSRILIDDVLLLDDATTATPDGQTTWLGNVFRSIQPAAIALSVALGGLLVAQIVRVLFTVLQSRLSAWLTFRIAANIRSHVYEHLHNLSIRFFDKRTTGTVISHITEDSERLQDFLLEGLSFLSVQLFLFFGIGSMLFWMNWKLACFYFNPDTDNCLGCGLVLAEGAKSLASCMAASVEAF